MDTQTIVTILALIALFSSLIYVSYKKKYDMVIGIGIMIIVLIVMRYVIKIV